jgi:CheY-like chemotaxis protein
MSDKIRLLIADDDIQMRNLLKRTLLKEGFLVETAANGREAIGLLTAGTHFDLLITDLRMPEKNGEELLADVRKTHPDLKVIVITGYSDLSQSLRLLRNGAGREPFFAVQGARDRRATPKCGKRTRPRRLNMHKISPWPLQRPGSCLQTVRLA